VPSILTMHFRSTWNQGSTFELVLLYPNPAACRLLLLSIIYPCERSNRRSLRSRNIPSILTPFFCSTRNQRRNCSPIYPVLFTELVLAVCLYCMSQHVVFFCCPSFILAYGRLVALCAQEIVPSIRTLYFRSTWNQLGSRIPLLAVVLFYRAPQRCRLLLSSIVYPCVRSSRRPLRSRNCTIYPYTVFLFDLEPARRSHPNPCHCTSLPHPPACCLLLLSSVYPLVSSSVRSLCTRNCTIYPYTLFSVDLEPTRQSHPNPCHCTLLQQLPVCRLLLLSSIHHTVRKF
jgi:hypothetical protein